MKLLLFLLICSHLFICGTNEDPLQDMKNLFKLDPSKVKIKELIGLQYVDFAMAQNDEDLLKARLEIAVTAYIYFHWQLAKDSLSAKQTFSDLLTNTKDIYNKLGLCTLINVGHTDGTDVQEECSEGNMENVEKMFKENGPNIQEAIYQIFLVFPPNERSEIFAKLGYTPDEQQKLLSQGENDLLKKEQKNLVSKEIQYLFGFPRYYGTLVINTKMKETVGDNHKPQLVDYFLDYFKHADIDNVIDKWRYFYAINYFAYKKWKDDNWNIIQHFPSLTTVNLLSIFDHNAYWRGEYHLREKVTQNKTRKPGESLSIRPKSMEEEAKEIFADPKSYAENELEKIPSYVEAMRSTFDNIWAVADKKTENLKGEGKRWVSCIELEFEQNAATRAYVNVGQNVHRQCETRTKALLELLVDNACVKCGRSVKDGNHCAFCGILCVPKTKLFFKLSIADESGSVHNVSCFDAKIAKFLGIKIGTNEEEIAELLQKIMGIGSIMVRLSVKKEIYDENEYMNCVVSDISK